MTIDEKSLEKTRRNVDSYERSARDYDALCVNDPPPAIAEVLRRFAEPMPRGARVLEVGSGPGRDADFLETLGVTVRRTDAVQAFLDIQAERGRKGELLNVVTDELGGPYDGLVALCVLIHVDREQTVPVLEKMRRALAPGGALLVSMRVGEHVEDDDYHTVYWTRDGFAERLRAAGFAIAWDLHFDDSAGDPWTIYCAVGRGLHRTAAEGFGHDATRYSRGRPGYPGEALDWLVRDLAIGPGKTVVEIGAGTGKFTKLLVRTGANVVAVEPVAAMAAQLTAELPAVRTLRAAAENLPFESSSADAVICAQSFHWFATADALAELHRVLKPGGVLALVWNVRDASVDWVARLERIVNRHEDDAPRYYNGEWRRAFPARGFGLLSEISVSHVHSGPAEQVIVDRVASVSFIAALPDATRRPVLDEVRALIASTPALAGKPEVGMPYVTTMYWCKKEDRSI